MTKETTLYFILWDVDPESDAMSARDIITVPVIDPFRPDGKLRDWVNEMAQDLTYDYDNAIWQLSVETETSTRSLSPRAV